jgi:hypothetical protein
MSKQKNNCKIKAIKPTLPNIAAKSETIAAETEKLLEGEQS